MKKVTSWLAICLFFLTAGIFLAQEEKKPENKPSADSKTASTPAGQFPHNYNITAEQAAKKNPVRFTDFSVERGKKVFSTQCAMCHGKNADGKGDPDFLAEIKASPPDFTKEETLKKRTDGDLFAIITSGSNIMPAQSDRMMDRHKWDLVNYVRSVCGRAPDKATDQERQVDTTTVPTK